MKRVVAVLFALVLCAVPAMAVNPGLPPCIKVFNSKFLERKYDFENTLENWVPNGTYYFSNSHVASGNYSLLMTGIGVAWPVMELPVNDYVYKICYNVHVGPDNAPPIGYTKFIIYLANGTTIQRTYYPVYDGYEEIPVNNTVTKVVIERYTPSGYPVDVYLDNFTLINYAPVNGVLHLVQTKIPSLNIDKGSAVVCAVFDISADESDVYVPIPASSIPLTSVEFAEFMRDDNYYVKAGNVTVGIPIEFNSSVISYLPNELYLDSDSKTFEFKKRITIHNPSDISVMATLSVDPSAIGVAQAYLDGSPMSMFKGSLVSSILIRPGESKVMELTATLPITKQEIEFRTTLNDFFEIDSFDEAMTLARSATEGKIETVTKVIAIDSADFKSFGNRTVIIPLDVKASNVIEAKALTGSKELLEVREGKDGKAEIVVPATVFEGTPLGTQHAEIKVIYNKKPAWWERLPFLKSLGGFFEFLAKRFGFGR